MFTHRDIILLSLKTITIKEATHVIKNSSGRKFASAAVLLCVDQGTVLSTRVWRCIL